MAFYDSPLQQWPKHLLKWCTESNQHWHCYNSSTEWIIRGLLPAPYHHKKVSCSLHPCYCWPQYWTKQKVLALSFAVFFLHYFFLSLGIQVIRFLLKVKSQNKDFCIWKLYVSFTEKKGVLLCFVISGSLNIRKTTLCNYFAPSLACYQKKANEGFCLAHLRAFKDYSTLLAGAMGDNFLITFQLLFFPFIFVMR